MTTCVCPPFILIFSRADFCSVDRYGSDKFFLHSAYSGHIACKLQAEDSYYSKRIEKHEQLDLCILRACHQLHTEATQILWKTNTFSFNTAGTFKVFMESLASFQRPLVRNLGLNLIHWKDSDPYYNAHAFDWSKWGLASGQPRFLPIFINLKRLEISIQYLATYYLEYRSSQDLQKLQHDFVDLRALWGLRPQHLQIQVLDSPFCPRHGHRTTVVLRKRGKEQLTNHLRSKIMAKQVKTVVQAEDASAKVKRAATKVLRAGERAQRAMRVAFQRRDKAARLEDEVRNRDERRKVMIKWHNRRVHEAVQSAMGASNQADEKERRAHQLQEKADAIAAAYERKMGTEASHNGEPW